MDLETARAIIDVAQGAGINYTPRSTGPSGIVALGEQLVEQAKEGLQVPEALKDELRDACLEIVRLATEEPVSVPSTEPPPEDPASSRDLLSEPEEPTPHRKITSGRVAKENLPEPGILEGTAPEMPRDPTGLDDRSVRRLMGEFNAWLNRVVWLIGVERSDEDSAKALAERRLKEVLRSLPRTDDAGGKKTGDTLKAEADADETLRGWTDRAVQHGSNLHALYSLKDIYTNNIVRLQAEWRARQDLWQKEGGSRG